MAPVTSVRTQQTSFNPAVQSSSGRVPAPSTESVRNGTATLRRGMEGPAVDELQKALVKGGYLSEEKRQTGPGIFGPATEAAVKALQQAKGLGGQAGVADKSVLQALQPQVQPPADGFGTPAPSLGDVKAGKATLKRGMEGEAVKSLQDLLVKTGYMTKQQQATGPGVFGPATEAAVKAFQKDARLTPPPGMEGMVGKTTYEALEKKASSSSGVTGPLPSTGNAFMDRIAAEAIKSQRQTGVPASVTMAQAALESGWGKSGLSQQANNFFGIKGRGPAGSVTMPTKEFLNGKWVTVNAPFRKYNSPSESFADHGKFLRENRRYANAFNHTDNARQFAREIHKAGYATDPAYSQKLINMIEKYGLERFDRIARGQ